MPIRNYSNPAYLGISPELEEILGNNGIGASVVLNPDNQLLLVVRGHDSPTLSYPITEAQARSLSRTGGATGSQLKSAYKTFTSIVAKDFYIPVDFTIARNANNRVSMGVHGYRMPIAGQWEEPFNYRPILGWTRPNQGGFHLRRVAGTVFYGGAPFVPNRPGSKLKPGEFVSGGYGFYWKGSANGQSLTNPYVNGANSNGLNTQSQENLLEELRNITIQPATEIPKPKKYSKEITSDVYFTTDKFLEILTSHGILVDKDAKTMTIRSKAVDFDMEYALSDDQLAILTDNSLEKHPLQERIDLINAIYGDDFQQKLTFAELDSEKPLNFEIGDHVDPKEEYTKLSDQLQTQSQNQSYLQYSPAMSPSQSQNQYQNHSQSQYQAQPQIQSQSPYQVSQQSAPEQLFPDQMAQEQGGVTPIYVPPAQNLDVEQYYRVQSAVLHADPREVAQVNGEDIYNLDPEKGWYREGNHGREVTVEQIIVYPIEGAGKNEKYQMTAIINGETISHKISQKDYDKFLALDDLHRMKLFSKIFPEVDLKDHNPVNLGTKIFTGIAAGLTVASELTRPIPPYPGPHHDHGTVYFKPGVDTPSDIARRAFEAGMNTERMDCDLHHGW